MEKKETQMDVMIQETRQYIMDNLTITSMSNEELEDKIEELIFEKTKDGFFSIEEKVQMVQEIYGSIRGFGILDSILSDDNVTEVMINGPDNIFISGGTGSGKTTFLNALSNYIPKTERVITIEDSAELQITGIENLVSMETRNANAAGAGAITIRDLIKSSLRMRPERIVVGEVRGGEALDMLQAMNTGHDGSLSTGHANSTHDMLSRLETMVLQGADGLPLEAIRQQIASAVDIIVHLSRLRDHSRKTMEITEVLGYRDGEIQLNPLYVFEEDENSTLEKVSGSLVRTKNPLVNDYKLKLAGVKEVI